MNFQCEIFTQLSHFYVYVLEKKLNKTVLPKMVSNFSNNNYSDVSNYKCFYIKIQFHKKRN